MTPKPKTPKKPKLGQPRSRERLLSELARTKADLEHCLAKSSEAQAQVENLCRLLDEAREDARPANVQAGLANGRAEKAERFKAYVHKRLDDAGVPADPEPTENAKHGCRIEGRLNYLEAAIHVLDDKRTAAERSAAEAQARERQYREALEPVSTIYLHCTEDVQRIRAALALKPDSSALDTLLERARRDGGERVFVLLKEHWLAGVRCDHLAEADTAECACSEVALDPQDSVGAAVDSWINHLRARALAATPRKESADE